jgi:hypothetical protein
MKKLIHPLLTEECTFIVHEDEPKFGTPHHFQVQVNSRADLVKYRGKMIKVDFQEGSVKENGVNGIANEDALVMVLARLEGAQNTKYKCEENSESIFAEAISHIEAALKILKERTNKRVELNVKGTSIV